MSTTVIRKVIELSGADQQVVTDTGFVMSTSKNEMYAVHSVSGRDIEARRLNGNQIVLIMDEDFAELMYNEELKHGRDSCSDKEALADALLTVGIGSREYEVELRVEMSTYVTLTVEADCEDEAGEKAMEAFHDYPSDYVDHESASTYIDESETSVNTTSEA